MYSHPPCKPINPSRRLLVFVLHSDPDLWQTQKSCLTMQAPSPKCGRRSECKAEAGASLVVCQVLVLRQGRRSQWLCNDRFMSVETYLGRGSGGWGVSSVVPAAALQAQGTEFDPQYPKKEAPGETSQGPKRRPVAAVTYCPLSPACIPPPEALLLSQTPSKIPFPALSGDPKAGFCVCCKRPEDSFLWPAKMTPLFTPGGVTEPQVKFQRHNPYP